MSEMPNLGELERLGLYEPEAPDAADRLELLRFVHALGATTDEMVEAQRVEGLGTLAMELSMRRPGEVVEFDTAAARLGLEPDVAAQLWRALGFPDPRSAPVRLSQSEIEALGVVAGLGAELLGTEAVVDLARVVGVSMAQVADAVVTAFRVRFEVPRREAGVAYSSVVKEYSTIAGDSLPVFTALLDVVFRRHMIAASYQMWSIDEDRSAVTVERTVGFVDLVGYTKASSAMSPADLSAAVNQFEAGVADIVAEHEGRLVKLIGDEAMFVVDDPAAACAIATALAHDTPLPPVRIGLASGSVVAMRGDYFGRVVNLASRLTDAARPSTVVVSPEVRDAANHEFRFRALPPLPLKGIGRRVRAYRLRGRREDR